MVFIIFVSILPPPRRHRGGGDGRDDGRIYFWQSFYRLIPYIDAMVEIINNVFSRRKYIDLSPEPFPVNIGKRRQTTDTSRKSILFQ